MKKNEWYDIVDLEKFVEATRVLVFDAFGKQLNGNDENIIISISDLQKEDIEELDSILSQEECLLMAKDYIKKTKRGCKISNKQYMAMIECFNGRMVSNMIHNLVNKGLLETAYDDKLNDFVFWVRDDNTKKEEN